MGYNTESTAWPSQAISPAIKSLLDKFLSLLDNTSSTVGDTLADEIFAPTAEAQFGPHLFKGQDEIRKSRDNAWTLFTARKHVLLRVYAHDDIGSDLMFLGHVFMDLKNGKHVAGEFTGRFTIADASTSSPRIQSYSIWADSAPLVKALKGD